MQFSTHFCFLFAALLMSSTLISAQASEKPFSTKFVIEGGIEFGGDELVEVIFEDGDTQTIHAGQGGYISVGFDLGLATMDKFFLRTMLGYKYVTTAAENANITFTRIPIYTTAFWKINPDFRVGFGVMTHHNVNLNGDGFGPDVKFEASPGARLEFGYKWIALTYTTMTYSDVFLGDVSGNSVGLSVSTTF